MEPASSNGTLDEIVSALSWLDWLGLAVVLVAVCVLVFLMWRRAQAKNDKKRNAPELTVPKEMLLAPDYLAKIWRNFIGTIPWTLRPDALRMPLSLVIGEAGCGKTSIIDRYADWQGQVFRFHPSATGDPLLQIYLGAKSLVLEFSASLLYDTTPASYKAIKKLWQRLPPRPQVVMVIDATTLLAPKMEQLRQSGHALFGKLKIFGELERQPLPLVIALSHMEKVPGFVEFCVFLEESGIPLQLDFSANHGIDQLETCLDGYKQHLRRALVTCPAQDYLKIASFLNETPALLRVLVDFLRVASIEQNVESPTVIRLCLLSEQVNSFACRPFDLPQGAIQKSPFILDRSAKVSIALFLSAFSYLVFCYHYQQHLLSENYKKISSLSTVPVTRYKKEIHPLFLDYGSDLNKDPLLTFMPDFFEAITYRNNDFLIREIRKRYLLPLLQQIQSQPGANFKTIRVMGLLYATPANELGKFIASKETSDPVDFAEFAKYGLIIQDYLKYNSNTDELALLLNKIDYADPEAYIDDTAMWLALFRNFQHFLEKPFINENELKSLQQKLVPFVKAIDLLEYYEGDDFIRQWLNKNTDVRLPEEPAGMQLRQKEIVQLLKLVSSLKLNNSQNCKPDISLYNCLRLVRAVADVIVDFSGPSLNFSIDGQGFSFNSGQWNQLIQRSRISMMLRDIVSKHSNHDGWLFFGSPSVYANVEMNATNDGGMALAGKASIDGRMTYDAFEQDVKPAVMALSEIIDTLPIDEREKKYFTEFVIKSLNIYADRYVNAYLNYFQQFHIRIDSVWSLNYVLSDLQQSTSILQQILVQIKKNTTLDFSASPYFTAFAQKLTAFRSIHRLMEEQNGIYTEFQKYQSLMEKMQKEISIEEPYKPKTDDAAGPLKGVLTPIGRVAWSMLNDEDGAYTSVVKKWLENVGIPDDWQQPFLAPVQKVEEFGASRINEYIDGIWSDIWRSNVIPLFVKFPFMPNAGPDQELPLDDLQAAFHPLQGVFWNTFQQYMSPLATFSNGIWIRQRNLSDKVVLPTNFFKRVNAAQQLTSGLWDHLGNPKPLELFVKPGLLPAYKNQQLISMPLVTLTYLRQGESIALGFNQQATSQMLQVQWWQPQQAEVGMEFRKDAAPTRAYSDIMVTDSNWNFFRLLQQGELIGEHHYRWLLSHPNFPQQPLSVEFSFDTNPMILFANLAGS